MLWGFGVNERVRGGYLLGVVFYVMNRYQNDILGVQKSTMMTSSSDVDRIDITARQQVPAVSVPYLTFSNNNND